MAPKEPATYKDALERIDELGEEFESVDALLVLRERVATDTGKRHALADVARELGAHDLVDR